MHSSSVPLRVSTGTFGSVSVAPASAYSSSLPSPSAAAAIAMQQAQVAARQQTAAAVQQQAALLTLGLGLPTLLNLNRAALAEVGTSPQAVLAALSNPNNAIGQILQSTSALSSNLDHFGALAASGSPQSDSSAESGAQPCTFAAANAQAAALHGRGAAADTRSAHIQVDHPRLHELLRQKHAEEAFNAAKLAGGSGKVIKDGAPCLLRDITGSLELPAGLHGEDAMVHHSATLVLSMCPMPTCRFVVDGKWGVPLSVHANRGIAGMFNWCLHDLLVPVSKMPGFMSMQEAGSMMSRMQAAVQARKQGLTSYSVRSLYVRPKSDSKGGWYDPHSARFERFAATEVIDMHRARNGSIVYNMHVMDIRPLEEGVDMSDAENLAAMITGKVMASCLDDYIAEIGYRLRSPQAPAQVGTHSPHGPCSSDVECKDEYGSAIEAWTASQGVQPEMAAVRVYASQTGAPPAIFEARTSLNPGQVKSIISSNHMSLGCIAYLAFLSCMVWSGHPRMEQALAAAQGQSPGLAGRQHEEDAQLRAVVPPATRTGAGTTFNATRPAAAGSAAAVPTPPTPAPASSAPSLDRLSQAAGMVLQHEQAVDKARSAAEVHQPSTANSSGSTSQASASGWAAAGLQGNDSLRQHDSSSQAGDFLNGVPLMGGAAGLSLENSSVSGFSLDRWDGASTSDGVGVFDQLMHPMAAGGVRMAPGAVLPTRNVASTAGDRSGFINLMGDGTLDGVLAEMTGPAGTEA